MFQMVKRHVNATSVCLNWEPVIFTNVFVFANLTVDLCSGRHLVGHVGTQGLVMWMWGRAWHGLHGDELYLIGDSARSIWRTSREAVYMLKYGRRGQLFIRTTSSLSTWTSRPDVKGHQFATNNIWMQHQWVKILTKFVFCWWTNGIRGEKVIKHFLNNNL